MMESPAASRFPVCLLWALFFLFLTAAALTRPLDRTKFNFSPDLAHLRQGITSHTFLEVTAGSPDLTLAYKSFASDDLQPVAQPDERNLEAASARQADNWPALFPSAYRHIPPSRSGDSDISA
jgi:hypothetical protein